MATIITIHYAKTHLSKLIARALAGEDIVIANRQTPQVRLTPVQPEPAPQGRHVFGSLKGKIALDDSFFDLLPEEELRAWEGR